MASMAERHHVCLTMRALNGDRYKFRKTWVARVGGNRPTRAAFPRGAWWKAGALNGKAGSHPQRSDRSILGRSLQGPRYIRCKVTVETGRVSSIEEKHRAALSKAK